MRMMMPVNHRYLTAEAHCGERVAFRTVHLTLLLNAVHIEHDLLAILGLGSALNERTCMRMH